MAQQTTVDLGWTQADIQALAKALKQGVRSVDYADRRVSYSSTVEMRQLLDTMIRYVTAQGDSTPAPNTRGSVFVRR